MMIVVVVAHTPVPPAVASNTFVRFLSFIGVVLAVGLRRTASVSEKCHWYARCHLPGRHQEEKVANPWRNAGRPAHTVCTWNTVREDLYHSSEACHYPILFIVQAAGKDETSSRLIEINFSVSCAYKDYLGWLKAWSALRPCQVRLHWQQRVVQANKPRKTCLSSR